MLLGGVTWENIARCDTRERKGGMREDLRRGDKEYIGRGDKENSRRGNLVSQHGTYNDIKYHQRQIRCLDTTKRHIPKVWSCLNVKSSLFTGLR